VPTACPDVPAAVLDPRGTWADKAAYDAQAAKLGGMFAENFKTFEADVDPAVVAAGPRV
jgi:phosphoenolpyruvate carboxykinase (ATP)